VLGWHDLVEPVIETKDFAVTLLDFMRGWDKVRVPYGEVMNAIVASIDAVPLPKGIEALAYGPRCNRLVRLCIALQTHHGVDPFFISVRQAGERIGVHYTEASKMLSALQMDGVLSLVSKGSGNKASRYTFSWNLKTHTKSVQTNHKNA
jgi:hypothetical protein